MEIQYLESTINNKKKESLIDLQIRLRKENSETATKASYNYQKSVNRKFEMEKNAEKIELEFENLELSKQDTNAIEDMLITAENRRSSLLNDNVLSYLTYGLMKIAPGELIMIVSQSGNGKTTTAASLVSTGVAQNKNIIFFNNEMLAEDIYFKIAAAYSGHEFHGIDRQTKEQNTFLSKLIKDKICHHVLVVDDCFDGVEAGVTTTPEGMKTCFTKLISSEQKFDLGILDYYQQIESSFTNPGCESWRAQEIFVMELSRFRKKSNMPMIVFAQVKHQDLKYPLKDRLEGRKNIINKADIILELFTDHENKSATLVVEKCRSNGTLKGKVFELVYKDGCLHPLKLGE